MLVKQELINKIKDYFELNIYETKVWLALLGKGTASAGEIAEISGVPRSRTYDVLESLEKKGFAIVKIGKPVRYIGIKPKMILEKLKNDVRRNAEERIVGLSNIKGTEEFTKLEELYKTGIVPIKGEDITAALQGRLNISNHIKEVLQNAEKEVIICTNANEIKSKQKLFQQTFANLNKGNIKINIALSGDEALIKQLEKIMNIRIKITDLDTKFFIVDRKEMLFYISKGADKEDVAIWLNSDFFASAFAALFEQALGSKK
jgi:sugar-specific transcriptional regulator TrmB